MRMDVHRLNATCRMLDAKTPSVCALPAAASEQSAAADDEQESERIANGGWPFQRVAEQLVANLLDANWQVRHGAAVGLRQLLRAQASSAAVQVPIADPLTGVLAPHGLLPLAWSCVIQLPLTQCQILDLCILLLDPNKSISISSLAASGLLVGRQ